MPQKRALIMGALVASLCLPSSALALDEVNSKKLRDGVTVNGILQHERALQSIANANGGTRASGTPGYEASLQYVKGRLAAGRLSRQGAGVHVPVLPRARAGRAVAGLADAEGLHNGDVRVLGQWRRHRQAAERHRQPGPAARNAGLDGRLRGALTSAASRPATSR